MTEQYNLGLDLGIFDNKITGSIDVFLKRTSDMLIDRPIQSSSGFSSILSNIGEMENKGIELMIESFNVSQPKFFWKSSLNFSALSNKITNLGGVNNINVGNFQFTGNTAIHKVGESVASYFGHEIIGIFQEEDDIAESAQPNAQPGHPIVRDANDDGVINQDDRVILGDPNPDFRFGISNSMKYKNFQLDIFIYGESGADLLSMDLLESLNPANFRKNRLAMPLVNRWTPENINTKWPSSVNPSSYAATKVNSLTLRDASFIRLKSVKLSYEIPQNYIRRASVSVSGLNLFTITDYVGNPDVDSFGRGIARIDFANYPIARTYMLGINLGF